MANVRYVFVHAPIECAEKWGQNFTQGELTAVTYFSQVVLVYKGENNPADYLAFLEHNCLPPVAVANAEIFD